jgi:lysine 2,3-aminomutase
MISDPWQDSEALARQFTPDPREAASDPFALSDPLGEARYRVTERLVHQYADRVLLKATGQCFAYCRYCFRRPWLSSGIPPFISEGELEPILSYLREHGELREILVSGGDPITADDAALALLFERLREARPHILLRVCTRAPTVRPERLDDRCIAMFRRFRPLRLVIHVNHPQELAGSAGERLAACVDAGIPVHTQTVLLAGINDSPAILAELFRRCLDLELSPYYLFQLDLAPGTAHFRVPLRRGLAIYGELKTLVSGLALPKYAVDLPGGGGKILLHEGVIAGEEERPEGPVYLLQGADGTLWPYPAMP